MSSFQHLTNDVFHRIVEPWANAKQKEDLIQSIKDICHRLHDHHEVNNCIPCAPSLQDLDWQEAEARLHHALEVLWVPLLKVLLRQVASACYRRTVHNHEEEQTCALQFGFHIAREVDESTQSDAVDFEFGELSDEKLAMFDRTLVALEADMATLVANAQDPVQGVNQQTTIDPEESRQEGLVHLLTDPFLGPLSVANREPVTATNDQEGFGDIFIGNQTQDSFPTEDIDGVDNFTANVPLLPNGIHEEHTPRVLEVYEEVLDEADGSHVGWERMA